jgi:hypothetical protein
VKRLLFQLPDSIHQDIARAQRGANQTAGVTVALYFNRLTHIANDDPVQTAIDSPEASPARGLAKGRFHQVSVQPKSIGNVQNPAARPDGPQQRFCFRIRRLHVGEERVKIKLILAQNRP